MRVVGKGLIDRDQPVSFSFDGKRYQGFHGDTLASALLANDVRLVARSFKYHRPRGILTSGCEEPNALVTIGSGAAQTPNVRATMQEIHTGLEAVSQNRWPSLEYDMLAVNDGLSRFLSAGFYYKTFMWPRSFWEKVYEPIIRRAAGLGALSGEPDTDSVDKAWAHCDVLVIGTGPAGLMAALTAARAGADVILAEEDYRAGGRLLCETHDINGMPGHVWVEIVLAELCEMDNVRIMNRTTVFGVYDQGTFGALERVSLHEADAAGKPRETLWRIVAAQAVLAAGSIERHIGFRDNDRPGVMTAGAVRSYLNRWGVSPGKRVTIFCNNDDAHSTARDLAIAGVNVAAVIDVRPDANLPKDLPGFAGAVVNQTRGRQGLRQITILQDSHEETIATDCLAVSGGWNPTVHLASHLNARPIWRDDIVAFVPAMGAVPNLIPCGAANGVFSTTRCLSDGIRAAGEALEALSLTAPQMQVPVAEDDPVAIHPYWSVPCKGRVWLDFQNDVTVKDIQLAAQENFQSVEHMKRYTTQGMATDQGKNSNVTSLAVLAGITGRSIPETGTTTFRPPFSPVSIAALGAWSQGSGFAPQRFITSNADAQARSAPMIEAGLWYRPAYFPRKGEAVWRESCDREVEMVRQKVGICDVSTLGKIDIQGPDAAALLDFVYANMLSTLKPGRVRYGLMLREDGFVMDDGTTARLGDAHYIMTTTTAAAAQVMRHLEFVRQYLRSELDVQIVSVTEQWAQFAVAGPEARPLLNAVLDTSIDNASWPFMSCGTIGVAGVTGRLFRISFSGEHAYELAVPARYGADLWRLLVEQAEELGGGPFGTEAMNVLRIEKGHITHAEIHGRTTAFDIGFDHMISAKKDCIGKTMAARPGLLRDDREQLVGLHPVDPDGTLTNGAHLFKEDDNAVLGVQEGYVTSSCYSPTLGSFLALGFLTRGRDRHGERLRMVDHLRKVETICEVCPPVFFDPDGGRLRG